MTIAAKTEFPAAARFSARINSGEGTAGLVAMQALSLLRAESDKRVGRGRSECRGEQITQGYEVTGAGPGVTLRIQQNRPLC